MSDDDLFLKKMWGVDPIKKKNRIGKEKPKLKSYLNDKEVKIKKNKTNNRQN